MEVKDHIYAFEIARRSVSRAAIHLGIESTSEETLDVLADILLQYLNRTGKALAHLVEASGRTSSHVNILDAFQACQVVASPAIQRLHLAPEDPDNSLLFAGTGAAATAAASATESVGAAAAAAAATNNSQVGGVMNHTEGGGSGDGLTNSGSYSTNNTNRSGSGTIQDSSTDWKGLAAFCFGPKWIEEERKEDALKVTIDKTTNDTNPSTMDEDDDGADDDNRAIRPGGGKVGPSSLPGDGVDGTQGDEVDANGGLTGANKRRGNRGWEAPYLDDVPEFPEASKKCANPHNLPLKVKLSLHYRKTDIDAEEAEEEEEDFEAELDGMPDDVFTAASFAAASSSDNVDSWGSMKKRKHEEVREDESTNEGAGGTSTSSPPPKRVRLNDGKPIAKSVTFGGSDNDKNDVEGMSEEADGRNTGPSFASYVPSFYPPPPRSSKPAIETGRTVVDIQEEQRNLLLEQQQQQDILKPAPLLSDAELEDTRGVRSSLVDMGQFYWGSGWDSPAPSKLAVPMGRPAITRDPEGIQDPIVPMSRASGSRVSRIIEGSMDASAMQ